MKGDGQPLFAINIASPWGGRGGGGIVVHDSAQAWRTITLFFSNGAFIGTMHVQYRFCSQSYTEKVCNYLAVYTAMGPIE
jgi:hypothetical protein